MGVIFSLLRSKGWLKVSQASSSSGSGPASHESGRSESVDTQYGATTGAKSVIGGIVRRLSSYGGLPSGDSDETARNLKRLHSLEEENSSLRGRVEELDEQNATRVEEIKQAKSKNAELEQNMRATRISKEELQKQYNDLVRAYRALEAQASELQSSLNQRDIKVNHLQAAVTSLSGQKDQMNQLIEQRNEEVQAVKEFLNTQDKLSGAEIVGQVRGLNEQIFQISAAMAESCKYTKANEKNSNHDNQHPIETLLRTTNHEENPEIVQIALQSALTEFSYGVIPGWGNHEQRIQEFLNALTRSVWAERAPAISRRWRSITHAHAMSLLGDANSMAEILGNYSFDIMMRILQTAGGIIDASTESNSKTRVLNLLRQVLDLQKIVNQDIMSCEYVFVKEERGTAFNRTTMLDCEFDEAALKKGADASGVVACTIGLGVIRVAFEKGTGSESRTLLLKPKVARGAYLELIKESTEEDEDDSGDSDL